MTRVGRAGPGESIHDYWPLRSGNGIEFRFRFAVIGKVASRLFGECNFFINPQEDTEMEFSRLIEKDGTGISAVTEKDGTGIRSAHAIEKDGTGIRIGSLFCSALMAALMTMALVAPVSAAEFGGMVNRSGGNITMSLSDGNSLLTGTGLVKNGYALVSLNGIRLPSAVLSEGDGTGLKSEGDGTGVASEGDGTGVASEGDGTGLSSEGDGTGLSGFCFARSGALSEGDGTGYTKSEGDGTGAMSEGDGTGTASEGDGTGAPSWIAPSDCEVGAVSLSLAVAEVALNASSASIIVYGVGRNGSLVELAAIEVPVINHMVKSH